MKFGLKQYAPILVIIIALFLFTQKNSTTTERLSFEGMDKKMIAMEGQPSWGLLRMSGTLEKDADLFVRETEFTFDEGAVPHIKQHKSDDWVGYPIAEHAKLYIVSLYEDSNRQAAFKTASLKEFQTHIQEYEKNQLNETIPFAYFVKDGEIIFLAEQYVS